MADSLPSPGVQDLLARLNQTPAAQDLRRRVEQGGALACEGVSPGAQAFVAMWLHLLFPSRSILVVTEGTKMQESLQQDLETWLFHVDQGEAPPGLELVSASRGTSETPPPSSRNSDARPGALQATPAQTIGRTLYFPAWEILPHEDRLPHGDVISDRLETLLALAGPNRGRIVIASVAAVLECTFHPSRLRESLRLLRRLDHVDPLDLVEWLETLGYEPEAQVNRKGDIALRGGILDVFPMSSPWPVRLEFFGDTIESIRHFDPVTQISLEEIPEVTLPPGGELGLLRRWTRSDASPAPHGQPILASLLDHLGEEAIVLLCGGDRLAEVAEACAEQIPVGDSFFVPWQDFMTRAGDLRAAVVGLYEPEAFPTAAEHPPEGNTSPVRARVRTELPVRLSFAGLESYRPVIDRAPEQAVVEAQRREFFQQLHRWLRQGMAVHVFCNNDGEQQRFLEIWAEYGLGDTSAPTLPATETTTPHSRLFTHLGAMTRGFLAEETRAVIVTDAEIFGRYKVMRPRRLRRPHASETRSLLSLDFSELEEGDLVVHVQHGIGQYRGLAMLPAGGGIKPLEKGRVAMEDAEECLVLEYAPSGPDSSPPRLYVPVRDAHLVSKYVGAGKVRPPLHTLGGTRWRKDVTEAQEAVRDLAGELLSIQAAREALPGHAFPADTPWQREFEGAFLYEETPDQMRAIQEAKSDMERSKPMDRLVCGDVGYGKTEVAIRAAFKAVLAGKQVAVLVPTTVLAQQHFNTFTERMADYPVRLELLSRFRSPRQQRQVLVGLASGAVDIVIGTHRLIQKDITFKDLGLVVIDEEQRFGVLHKEQFKRLRRLVDVLTLSATPIPRTLHLALAGARDMSTIETPPQDRLPVQTIVCEYDERVIRDAIQRELNRQGQVFYLHNRVMDIENVRARLQRLLPHARIVVGHGQLDADLLEEVMTRFVNGQADVLLSTTIIESGLDIPNANTIIIERADRFGLSDLYQLRGRVGRYKHQAYAYLLIPRHARMLTDARKRISAIKQYSSLGSGFKIAMRDLEIRGAGDLLGRHQSGHITAVGFDLYCQLLKQTIRALKGEPVQERVEVHVRLDFLSLGPGALPDNPPSPRETSPPQKSSRDGSKKTPARPADTSELAYFPPSYIADPRQRLQLYRKLAEISALEELKALEAEVRDRFGPLPEPVSTLLEVAGLKVVAASKGLTSIETQDGKVLLLRHRDYITRDGRFPRLTARSPQAKLKELQRLVRSLPA